MSFENIEYMAFPMVCFCDIPLSRISEHVDFYGSYGIGLTKSWAMKNVLNPVIYVSSESMIKSSLMRLIHLTESMEGQDSAEQLDNLRLIASHMKPLQGTMHVAGKAVEKEFYSESEWRFVPLHISVPKYAHKKAVEDDQMLSSLNRLSKQSCMLRFTPEDIRYIFVKNDKDIPKVLSYIQREMSVYSEPQRQILMSRVTSLESIRSDV